MFSCISQFVFRFREIFAMENNLTIVDMPFEVLDLIFKELFNLKDKLQLAQAHEKLGRAFSYHSRSDYRSLYPYARIRPEMWVVLVQECGATIEEFSTSEIENFPWNDLLAKAIEQHCPNLKSVKICVYDNNCDSVQSFLLNMSQSLTSVELTLHIDDTKKIFDAMAKMTKLTKFTRKGIPNDEVYQIQKLTALEELVMDNNDRFNPNSPLYLLDICAPLKNLRSLTVLGSTILPSDKPHSMIWVNLEHLTIDFCQVLTELPECPKLKTLHIVYSYCNIDGLLFRFILQNGRNLVKINENSRTHTPDGESLLQVLRSCPKLRTYSTPMQNFKIYQAYVPSIVEVLRENGVKREKPFHLIINAHPKCKWLHQSIPRASYSDLIFIAYFYN
ncbi:uncharacterized protein LOC128257321 isoform X2 [Drosophila gunungcola]|uniref:uncharacterized protein LOC128257321 isoform X2 n=1 Tax=Drosophila gunungcola TaxID=103775 RepID=UPI0022DF7B02|nr:uncharacterized protein LOC128257321 isoform X2 [Drosophila gunungcola]